MTFEKGGIADKQGNVYENRFLAKILLCLVQEEITSVVVEPAGEVTSICEFYTKDRTGKITYYQCKGSNGANDHWVLSDLTRYNLFTRIKELLSSDADCKFCFVSPLYYKGLDDLCVRARKYSSVSEYLKYALTNEKLRKAFNECKAYFNLDGSDPNQLRELVNILSRCEFRVHPNNFETVQDLERFISVYFYGIPGNVRVLLENYVNDTASYNKELTALDVINFLAEKDIKSRIFPFDTRIVPVITRLNQIFSKSYNAIHGSIFHRHNTDLLINEIEAGKSVIVHGKAGAGKSGCIRELIDYLEYNQIGYLAIQLDKHMPVGFADKYGEELGLPESPVDSLFHISGSKPCVLILDQLDSIRWTAMHSSTALDICKEMILQAQGINKFARGAISIVFSVRTFDYENDAGIKSLFIENNQEMQWSKIQIDALSDNDVAEIVGNEYKLLSRRVKELIRVPSSLFVWTQLDSKNKMNLITSSQDLVSNWWKQTKASYVDKGQDEGILISCVDSIVTAVKNLASFAVPKAILLQYSNEVEYLISCGMLIQDNNSISFAHQSFLDSFLLEKDLKELFCERVSLLSLVLSWRSQMPIYRYRLTVLLQTVIDSDQGLFAKQAREYLESDKIHFYFKAVVFEVISQLTTPDHAIFALVGDYYSRDEWHNFILQTVFNRHPVFIEHIKPQNSLYWFSEEGYPLLATMKMYSPEYVISVLQELIESNAIEVERIFKFLGTGIEEENEVFFAFRVSLYKNNLNFLSDIHYIDLDQIKPNHVLQVLELVLRNVYVIGENRVYIEEKKRHQFCEDNYKTILSSLFDLLCRAAQSIIPSLHVIIDYSDRLWIQNEPENSFAREIVELVKDSLGILAVKEPEEAERYILQTENYRNGISNELALATAFSLSSEYSSWVIKWILSDFDNHIIDCTSNQYDYLQSAKEVIKKHSSSCSKEQFIELENVICSWKGDREYFIEEYKYRFELNQSKEAEIVYFPAWGHLQKNLLPFLDSSRIQKGTKELIDVLNRNKWVRTNNFHAGIIVGSAKSVVSTIHKNAIRFSDKTWLNLVSADISDYQSRMREKDDGEYYYESSHRAFAQDLGDCVKNDPIRYANLVLKFPENCPQDYYLSVLYRLSELDAKCVDFTLLCDVIRRIINTSSDKIHLAVTNVINKHLEERWPEDLIDYLIVTATGNLKPIGNENIIHVHDNDPYPAPEDMMMAVLNCPRGAAVDTIGRLLFCHPDLCEKLAPYMEVLSHDESDVVRFALTSCAAAYYQYDPEFARCLFDTLLEKDIFVLCAKYAFDLMRRDLHILEEHYFKYMKKACCESPNKKLVIYVAQLICISAVITNNEHIMEFLYSYEWSSDAVENICMKAVEGFKIEEYRPVSQRIMEHFLEERPQHSHCFSYLFREKLVDFDRDEQFIITILQKSADIDIISDFLEFIKEQDVEIAGYAKIIAVAVKSVDENIKAWQKYRIEDGLVHAIIKLVDTADGDDELIDCCLDILDEIYRKRMLNDSAVSELINGIELL